MTSLNNSNTSVSFKRNIMKIVSKGNVNDMKALLNNSQFTKHIQEHGDELIEPITKCIAEKRWKNQHDVILCYEEMLQHIAGVADANTLFIELLGHLDDNKNTTIQCFLSLLEPTKIVLHRLHSTRGSYLACTLNSIQRYVNDLSPPEDYQLEKEERKFLLCDKYISKLTNIYELVFSFFESFADNPISDYESNAILFFYFHLLSGPLLCIHLEYNDTLNLLCHKIVDRIRARIPEATNLLENLDEANMQSVETDSSSDEDNDTSLYDIKFLPHTSVAMYIYLLSNREEWSKHITPIYNPIVLFHKLLYLSTLLIDNTHNAACRKGLLLSKKALSYAANEEISYSHLALKVHKEFVKLICNVSVYSYINENRNFAIGLLRPYIVKFDPPGRYFLLDKMARLSVSSSYSAHVILLFKETFEFYYRKKPELNEYFSGKRLIDLVYSLCNLKIGVETDIVDNFEKLQAFLNLLLFMFVMDSANRSGFVDSLEYYENNIFPLLQTACRISTSQYKQRLKQLTENKGNSNQIDAAEMSKFEVVVDGEVVKPPDHEGKIKALTSALSYIDVIQFSSQRILEIVTEKMKK